MPRLLLARRLGPALITLALVGCGSSDPAPTAASTVHGPASGATVAQAPIPPARAIATREGRIDGEPVTLELSQLRRRGQVVNLEVRLATRAAEFTVSGLDALDDGVSEHLSGPPGTFAYEGNATLDGIDLIDGVHGRRYAPARDRFNHCTCDAELEDVTLAPGRPVTLSATFGAPPADVEAVDVVIPRFGTIPDVPLA